MKSNENIKPIAGNPSSVTLSDPSLTALEREKIVDLFQDIIPAYRWNDLVKQEEIFKQVGSVVTNVGGTSVTYNSRTTTVTGGGAKTATFVIGPSSNNDSDSYDYVTDGTNDNVQIQAAIDALPSGGGKIILREGTYTLGATVLVNEANVILQGVGDATIVKPKTNLYDGASVNTMFAVSVADCVFQDIYFDGNSANQADDGSIIDFISEVDGCSFFRCKFVNAEGSSIISPTGVAGVTTYFANCYFSGWDADNEGFSAIEGDYQNNLHISDCAFINTKTAATYIGSSGRGAVIRNSYFYMPSSYNSTCINELEGDVVGNYFLVDGAAGSGCTIISFVTWGNIHGNHIESSGSNAASVAIRLNGGIATGNYISGFGIACDLNSASTFSSNIIENCTGNNILVGDSCVLTGNSILDTVPAADNTYSGIKFGNSADHNIVTNNYINGLTTGNDLKYCIEETTSCNYNIIEHNIATGADTAQINVVGANTISANNITA